MIIPLLSNVQVVKPCGVEDRSGQKWKKYLGLGCIASQMNGFPNLPTSNISPPTAEGRVRYLFAEGRVRHGAFFCWLIKEGIEKKSPLRINSSRLPPFILHFI